MQTNLGLRNFMLTTAFIMFAFASYILVFTRVPKPTLENTNVTSGRVVKVHYGGVNDVVIRLPNDERFYYINRGLERGLDLDRFAQQLEGKNVNLYVIERNWTPLDPSHNLAPVGRVSLAQNVLFTDF